MEYSAYRQLAIEIKASESSGWVPYSTINHRRDFVTSKLSIYSQTIDQSRRHKSTTEFCQSVDTIIYNSRVILDAIIELNFVQDNGKITEVQIPEPLKPFCSVQSINLKKEFWYGGKYAGKSYQRARGDPEAGQSHGLKGTEKYAWPGYEDWEKENSTLLQDYSENSERIN